MILDNCYIFPKLVLIKYEDRLDVTDCVNVESIEVYSLNNGSIGTKYEKGDIPSSTSFSIMQENEKLILVPPINNYVQEYIVKYEKSITKERYEKGQQEFTSLLIRGAEKVKCSICGEQTRIYAKQSEDNEHYYLFNKCPNCMTESLAFALAKIELEE